MGVYVNVGESVRFDCDNCSAEWEVLHEPKVKENPRCGEGMEAKRVGFCPGCGEAVEIEQ